MVQHSASNEFEYFIICFDDIYCDCLDKFVLHQNKLMIMLPKNK